MKKIGVYGRMFSERCNDSIQHLFNRLLNENLEVYFYETFHTFLKDRITLPENPLLFRNADDVRSMDIMFSIGGDGTLMDSTAFVRSTNIPIMGINTGRLGFMSSVQLSEIDAAIDAVLKGDYVLDQRTLLRVEADGDPFGDQNFALNELTVHKNDSASMIITHVYINDRFLNSYWADGLIVATATGSTAYSLSCGGPIVIPGSNNFVISPVAPHNLNVRPIVIPDDSKISLEIEGRSPYFLASLDSRSVSLKPQTRVTVTKNDFNIQLLRLKDYDYLWTLRSKLNWGKDMRN